MKDTETEKRLGKVEAALQRIEAALLGKQDRTVIMRGKQAKKKEDPMPWGSDAHATWMGVVQKESVEQAQREGFQAIYASPKSGRVFVLADEWGPYEHSSDPKHAAMAALRGKISNLESDVPSVPADAPPMFDPGLTPEARTAMGLQKGNVVIVDGENCGTVGYF